MDRDNDVKRREPNPRETANLFSLITFFYTIKVYVKGFRKGLEISDIFAVAPKEDSTYLAERLSQHWKKEQDTNPIPSLSRVLWKCYSKTVISIGLVQFVVTILVTTWSPKALSKLIAYFAPNQKDLTKEDAFYYACLVLSLTLINTLVNHNFLLLLALHAIKAKAAVSALLYRKSLKLSSASLSHVTPGKIVTIISKDLDGLESIFISANNIWAAAVQTVLICYLIYRKIGVASVPGVAFFIVVLPLQVYIGKLSYSYQLECNKKTDDRLDLIREILAAGKVIKMYTWEKFFEQKIHAARKEELIKLHKIFYARVWITVIGSVCSKTAFFLFVMTYVWTDHNVSAETVYYILSCFGDLENSLSKSIPLGFSCFAQLFASMKRVESVLAAEETPPKHQTALTTPRIVFNKVDVRVHGEEVLKDVELTVDEGLTVVVGRTGSGKTTLLKAVLQECEIFGDASISGRISYAPQEPWLFPSTIKNNILFGEEYNQKRYHEVLRVCNLEYDLLQLPEGDATVIKESGINLSKGQQARINLARAVYRNADIYLLDDCLTSLDGKVSDDNFTECICEFLHDKIRIFVTNTNSHIRSADRIISIESKHVEFATNTNAKNLGVNGVNSNSFGVRNKEQTTRRVYHDNKHSGRVPIAHYYKYVQNGGGIAIFAIIVSLFVLTQTASSFSDKLISQWVTLQENLTIVKEVNDTNTSLEKATTTKFTLSVISAAAFLLLFLAKSFSFFHFMQVASSRFHKKMVQSVLNSTMKFFDSHFLGNVINRFTKDFMTLDETLPFVAMDCFEMIFIVSGGVVLLTTVNYIFLLESLVLLGATCCVKELCQPTGRDLERLHVIARGPLIGHLNSTLEGLTTIRASDAEGVVIEEFDHHQNLATSAFFMVVTNFRTVSIFLKYICMIFTTFVIFQFLVTDIGSSVGDVGLAITQSFIITKIISEGVMSVADCENLMICVQRILELSEIEREHKKGETPSEWPERGSISFSGVSLYYSKHAMLNDINFSLKPKEKLGVVGRTGAGKSSVISSLFRLYPTEGAITIDGVNINDISLDWLRSNISVIPQDPYLFPGTMRENLDPLKRYQDHELWKILQELRLDSLIEDLDVKIDKGTTFSAGQKQLLCFARVILRKNKIVVFDEVTANVDQEVEDMIQEAIRKYFVDCTMLIVAHKKMAVTDCDKIMVLDSGRIKEIEKRKSLT